jgi:hypothetical protein
MSLSVFKSLFCRAHVALIAAVLACGAAAPALAAEGELLFEDNFAQLDPSFGAASQYQNVADNHFVVQLNKQEWSRRLYESLVFENIDYTVQVQIPDMSAETGAGIGIMFWAAAVNDCYLLEISDAGTYAVRRFTPERIYTPISWRDSEAINIEPGAWNELRVVTVGNRATVYINGQQLATLRGKAPAAGGMIGMFVESGDTTQQGMFSELSVIEPTAATSNEQADPSVILADDFTTFDPSWGVESGWLGIREGRLFVDFEPSETFIKLNQLTTVQGDFDATVTVALEGKVGEPQNVAGAALAFWAQDAANFYMLSVYDNGTMDVRRRVGDEWKVALAAKEMPAEAKALLAEGVALRVVTSGRRATFYVGGVEVGSIFGQPPQGESLIGFFAESGDLEAVALFDDLTVRISAAK